MREVRPAYLGRRPRDFAARLDRDFGPGWRLVHRVGRKFYGRPAALQLYEDAYFVHVTASIRGKTDLEWLVATAGEVYETDPSNVKAGRDYDCQETPALHFQDIALRRVLARLGIGFQGSRLVQVGKRDSEGARLSAGVVPFHLPHLIERPSAGDWWMPSSIADFWYSNMYVVTLEAEDDADRFAARSVERV